MVKSALSAAAATLLLLAGCAFDRAVNFESDGDAGQGGSAGQAQGGSGGQGGSGAGPSCGDGTRDPGEDCDDGMETATCDDDCTTAACGDDNLNQAAGEQCDDGNTTDEDGCDASCQLEDCGDGVVQPSEECDLGDGNNNDNGACTTLCTAAVCGDGFVYNTGGGTEECDDDNANNNDDCLNTCVAARCGDGVVHDQQSGVEECDDQNTDQNDACLDNCQAAACGDGIIQAGVEQCDDDGTANGDGCDMACMREAGACCDGEPSSCATGPHMIGANMLGITIPDAGLQANPFDLACHTAQFNIPGCGTVTDVDVVLGVDHDFVGDLIAGISHPAGMNLETMMDFPGFPNSTNGDSSNLDPNFPITFSEGAAVSAEAMGNTINSNDEICKDDSICTFDPSPGSLASYNGMTPDGSWRLCIGDFDTSRTDTLQEVRFIITTQ